jgi:nitroreductase
LDVFSAILKRRSIRSFTEAAVAEDSVLKMLEAARWAPSGGNRQPWRFVVVQDRDTIRMIKMFAEGLSGTPTLVIAICTEKRRVDDIYSKTTLMDIGMTAENIMLEAVELGLGSCAIASFSEEPVKRLLGIPDETTVTLLLSMGYPDKEPAVRPRKAVEEITYSEKWGERLVS